MELYTFFALSKNNMNTNLSFLSRKMKTHLSDHIENTVKLTTNLKSFTFFYQNINFYTQQHFVFQCLTIWEWIHHNRVIFENFPIANTEKKRYFSYFSLSWEISHGYFTSDHQELVNNFLVKCLMISFFFSTNIEQLLNLNFLVW